MNRTPSDAALERKIADLKERTRKAETILKNRRQLRENRDLTKQRKIETRRYILTGKAITALADAHPQIDALVHFALNRHLTNKRDRALFDLPPLDAAKPASGSSPHLWRRTKHSLAAQPFLDQRQHDPAFFETIMTTRRCSRPPCCAIDDNNNSCVSQT